MYTSIKQLQKLQKEVRMAMPKKYSNKGSRDDNKINTTGIPYIVHTRIFQPSLCPHGAVECVCDVGILVVISTTLV